MFVSSDCALVTVLRFCRAVVLASQLILLVLVHALWAITWLRTGVRPTMALGPEPLPDYPVLYSLLLVAILMELFTAPVVALFACAVLLKWRTARDVASALLICLAAAWFWVDPWGALLWFTD